MTALPTALTAGTWNIDALHSEFGFVARHAGVSKVKGKFTEISGALEVGESLEDTKVVAKAVASSITTGNEQRDGHLQSGDFFLAEEHPEVVFESIAFENWDDDEFTLRGTLTMRGVSKEVAFDAEFNGVATGPDGSLMAGFSAETTINRKDFGMTFHAVLGGGELLVSDKVKLHIEIEAIKAD
ncbi:YceI family protein [Brevibacterium samyangense]|uniref:YceI family protein n=1 Tax=Brevibacterium samyangense TaxID=366888 RepID=A0ABN2TA49_9MICO